VTDRPPPTEAESLTSRDGAAAYEAQLLIRRFEEAAYGAYERGDVLGSVHASIGQEAVAVGVISALSDADLVLSHHRGHGHALAKGVDANRLMAELLGRQDGVCRGKGGSMHITDVRSGFLGSLAVVGSSIPLAVGAGLSAKMSGSANICVVFFGDGAINQGVLYESLNLAAIWSLPVLFVCENNGFAISVRADDATAGGGVTDRAAAFGVRAARVDGQDVVAVQDAASALIGFARESGPALLECLTYRYMGHSRGDPPHGLYRTEEELAVWQERDPLAILARAAGLSDDTRVAIESRVNEKISAALRFAYDSAPPDASTAFEDIWG
jgi:pyruvate dehydrogenase E1 component alpha subunit